MSKAQSRMLPTFQIHSSYQFYLFEKFLNNTMVLPLKVETYNGNQRSTIIFDVIDEEDRLKALGSLGKLRGAFNDFDVIIIREYGVAR